jgi:type I restriction enzyme S subunit
MAAAIFKAWFVDFEPVKAKAAGATRFPTMPQPVFDVLPSTLDESEIGRIPSGWRVRPLAECTSVVETGNRPKGGVKGIKTGIPSIGAESIIGIGQFEFSKTKYVPPSFYESMKRGKVESHDVLLYKDGGVQASLSHM